jgi:N-acetylmuramoyl-L-alanine amidase
VAIEVSGSFEFRTERLHNPERVYYDILNSHVRIDSKHFYIENVTDSLLQKIRVAENTPGTTRVVLDLTGNVVASTSTLTNPDRLIIELRLSGGNPLRTEVPPPVPADRPIAATPPPVAAAKPAPAPAKPLVKTDFSAVEPSPKVSAMSPDALKPAAATVTDAPTPAPAAAHSDSQPVPDPGPAEIAKAARTTSSGVNSLIRTLGLKINRVVIDPGHGGHDQGTEGPKGLLEKDVVLDIALRVGKLVQDRMAAEVIYTRSDDSFVTLEGRTALANEKKADLFLSIHANSSPPNPQISGVETYYLNINGPRDAMDLARRENGLTHDSIFELQDLVTKIAQRDKSEESLEFAKRVQAALYTFSQKYFPGTRDRGVKTAPFIVLIGANMPSVLAEIGFVSNSREENLLKKSEYRDKLAEALYSGIQKYAESLSHFQVAVKP